MTLDPAICKGAECGPDYDGIPYCGRCILALKGRLCPNMPTRDIFAFYDDLSRKRSLTEPESVLLEYAMKISTRNVEKKRRRKAA